MGESVANLKCWASHRGDCDQMLSREHLISKALFAGSTAIVSGFSWCKEPQRIGINALTRKLLCKRHNSALSPADEAIASLNSLAAQSGAEGALSGYALESWFLKALINLSYGCGEHIGVGMSERAVGRPPPYLVEVALGRLRFSHWMGLYVLSTKQTYQALKGEVLFAPFTKDGEIGGALFEVAGINFFLSLLPGHRPTTIGDISSSTWPAHVASAPLIHRPIFLKVRQWQGDQSHITPDWAHDA